MGKQQYYVDLSSRRILTEKHGNQTNFIINATESDVTLLQGMLNKLSDADFASFLRAPNPVLPYHKDGPNDDYDEALKEIYTSLYVLGNNETRTFIENSGMTVEDSPLS